MTLTTPGPTLGVVGGGQLGRMLAESANPLGIDVIVLDPTERAPATPVATDHIVAAFDDREAIRDLARRSDVLTYEIELADEDALAAIESETGTPVHPRPGTLATIADKYEQKQTFANAGIPVPDFRAVDDADDAHDAIEAFGTPAMLKARRGGYDGRGNVLIEDPSDIEHALEELGGPAMIEEFVDFERELAVIACQGDDEIDTFPVTETIHEAEILRETIAPARTCSETLDQAAALAEDVLDALDGRGVYGVETFETSDGEILLNEVAPRPHNSGHWTIEGAVTSQFEQHARAVTGRPLGSTTLRSRTVSTNILGAGDPRPATLQGVDDVLDAPKVALHWYGKQEVRPLRKMGHLTTIAEPGADPELLLERIRHHRDSVSFA
ncbi:MAG: 5-(carboxyamino)imidazole ribonucleotide synthase [Halococcoides sp.]